MGGAKGLGLRPGAMGDTLRDLQVFKNSSWLLSGERGGGKEASEEAVVSSMGSEWWPGPGHAMGIGKGGPVPGIFRK